jgi:hypothetical protein
MSLSTTSILVGGTIDSCLLLGKVALLLMQKVAPLILHLHPHHTDPVFVLASLERLRIRMDGFDQRFDRIEAQ